MDDEGGFDGGFGGLAGGDGIEGFVGGVGLAVVGEAEEFDARPVGASEPGGPFSSRAKLGSMALKLSEFWERTTMPLFVPIGTREAGRGWRWSAPGRCRGARPAEGGGGIVEEVLAFVEGDVGGPERGDIGEDGGDGVGHAGEGVGGGVCRGRRGRGGRAWWWVVAAGGGEGVFPVEEVLGADFLMAPPV